MNRFKDVEHLFRVALVFIAGILAFVILRAVLVPRSFGEYGHYRGNAITEIAARPIAFAGHQTCEACHSDVLEIKSKGKHAHVNCEACHGALAKHTEDPASIEPPKLDTAVLCVRCHAADGAKPRNFPQVVAADHSSGLPCGTCHQPHSPLLAPGGKP